MLGLEIEVPCSHSSLALWAGEDGFKTLWKHDVWSTEDQKPMESIQGLVTVFISLNLLMRAFLQGRSAGFATLPLSAAIFHAALQDGGSVCTNSGIHQAV